MRWTYPWALAVTLALGACGSSDDVDERQKGSPAAGELELVSEAARGARLHELTLRSPALAAKTRVSLLLPSGYDPSAAEPYPVLYLLPGCCDDHRSWLANTDLERFTAAMPIVIVMPEAGLFAFFSDWFNGGAGGAPRWETYHVRELLPWIEQHYHVRHDRGGRMLAGLSMGGHGAFAYAARYPHLFASATALSPMVDTNSPPMYTPDSPISNDVWGTRLEEEVRWRGHNPWDLAENLSTVALFMRTGDGTNELGVPQDQIEIYAHMQAESLHQELVRLGIEHEYDDYGAGMHTWNHWQDGLHRYLPQQLALAQARRPEPRRFSYRSIAPQFAAFGWEVAIERDALEFARLGEVSEGGFTLAGSGRAEVRTAPWFTPRQAYAIALDGTPGDCVVAAGDGRLTLTVDLGPPRTIQQYRPGSPSGYLREVRVTIAPCGTAVVDAGGGPDFTSSPAAPGAAASRACRAG